MKRKLLQRRTCFFLGRSLCLIICLALPITLWAMTPGEITYEITAGAYQLIGGASGACQIKMLGEDYGVIGTPGDPALPERIIKIPVPLDADLSGLKLTLVNEAITTLEGSYLIIPQPSQVLEGQANWDSDKSFASGKNPNVYQKDSFYPSEYLKLLPPVTGKEVDPGQGSATKPSFKLTKYIRVAYRPFLYNPVTEKLKLIKKATIKLTYQGNLASKNLAAPSNSGLASQGTGDYVIITTNNIVLNSAQFFNFYQMKIREGHRVQVVTENEYGGLTGQAPNGTAEKIRQWLINHEAPNGTPLGLINYVLLIGDPDPDDPLDPNDSVGDVPMKMCYPRYYELTDRNCPTDYFYADLTGNWDLDGDQFYGVDVDLVTGQPQSPDPAIAPDTFSARWSGKVNCDFTETYMFSTFSDEGVRVYLDGNLVIDNWTNHFPAANVATPSMSAGLHDIIIDYREVTGHAMMKLFYETMTLNPDHYISKQIIPQDHLYYYEAATGSYLPGGLNVTYYDNDDFTGTTVSRIDPTIDFIWDKSGDNGSNGREPVPDVFVGRIPVYDNNYADLDRILGKIIQYETNSGDINWRRSILLPMKPPSLNTPGYHLGEEIRNKVALPAGFDVHRIYDDFTGSGGPAAETMPCNETNVVTEWQNGYGMVTWFTHGSSRSATGVINDAPAAGQVALLNDTRPSFTFQASCDNGCPENHNNLGYAILRHGGIATVSSSRSAWYSPGNTNIDNPTCDLVDCFAYAYTKRVISDGLAAGVALGAVKGNFQGVHMNTMDFNLYGDPDCFLITTYPSQSPLSFENPARPWIPGSSNVTLSLDTDVKTEGTASLKLNGTGFMIIKSPVFGSQEINVYSNRLSLNVYLTAPPTNPSWLGEVELHFNAPSAGIFNQYVGSAQLTGLEVGQWNTIQFTLPPNIVSLFTGSYSDIQISLVVNTSQDASNPYRIDNLRFTGTLITK